MELPRQSLLPMINIFSAVFNSYIDFLPTLASLFPNLFYQREIYSCNYLP